MSNYAILKNHFNNNNIYDCHLYGIPQNLYIWFNTISELMDNPKFDDLAVLYIESVKKTRYSNELNFKYPKNLKMLTLHYNSQNQIKYPDPPDSVEYLAFLNCSYGLPKLPKNLKELSCKNCNIDCLPQLPENLVNLHCSSNNLTELPELPKTMKRLCVAHNKLKQLPKLPNGIECVECSYNQLTKLPEIPNTIMVIYCVKNRITELPFSLLKCTLNVNYYDNDNPKIVAEGKERNDKYEFFIFHDNPVQYYIWKHYDGPRKQRGIKRHSKTDRLNWYFDRLKAIKKIESEYIKRRYEPKYGFCKYMQLKELEELYEKKENPKEIEVEL